jgi:hypothetical protein
LATASFGSLISSLFLALASGALSDFFTGSGKRYGHKHGVGLIHCFTSNGDTSQSCNAASQFMPQSRMPMAAGQRLQ